MKHKKLHRLITTFVVLSLLFFGNCCKKTKPGSAKFQIISEIKSNPDSPFYVDFTNYPENRKPLPVGVFDSGTGGLTVLDSIVSFDGYNNSSRESGKDGIPDFKNEHFVYLGDSANMPYGRYDGEGKSDFLRELIIKDVQFLLGRRYYRQPGDTQAQSDKEPVKVVVIACNTATAFGFDLIREAVREWGVNIEVLGIISAGTKAAAAVLPAAGKAQTVGIFATEGTCASGGYPDSMKKQCLKKQVASASREGTGNGTSGQDRGIAVVQQAGFGLAAAIDGSIDYIDPAAKAVRGAEKYRGPGLDHPRYPIDLSLWQEYNFEENENNEKFFAGNFPRNKVENWDRRTASPALGAISKEPPARRRQENKSLLLRKNDKGEIIAVELNSIINYIKYHVTHLVVKTAQQYPDRELSTVILGCTHYPFFADEIAAHFRYLKQQKEEYNRIIAEKVTLIDPAEALAVELYEYLSKQELFAIPGEKKSTFYISLPNPHLGQNRVDEKGEFLYDYKYGRSINSSLEFVKRVPFSEQWIKPEVLNRVKVKMPEIYNMIF